MKKSIVHLHKVPKTVPNICSKKNNQEEEEAWLSLLTIRFLDIDFLAGDHLERSTSARRSQGRQSLRHSPDERRRSNAHGRHDVVSFFFDSFYTVSSFLLRPATLWKTRLSHTWYITARCTASLSELQVLIKFGPSSGHLEFHRSTTDLQWFIFLVANFRHFPKSILKNNILWQIPCFLGGKYPKKRSLSLMRFFLIT